MRTVGEKKEPSHNINREQMMNQDLVLAVNAGSSSLKVSLLSSSSSLSESTAERLLTVLAERLLTDDATLRITWHPTTNEEESGVEEFSQGQMDATQAMEHFVEILQEKRPDWIDRIVAVGHRVVHGGTLFRDSVVVDEHVLHRIETVSHLAPLHNPSNLAAIRILRKTFATDIPHVAVFDTSFHSTIPEKAYTYPLPKEYRDAHMRKFGFHGTSVRYVVTKATQVLLERTNPNRSDHDDDDFRIIVCHLGSGASVTAVVGNKSVDTSMGFTPLAGLMMGTRCGSVDPSLVGFAVESLGKTVEEVMMDFNKRSGLRGMVEEDRNDGTPTGGVYDMRTLLQSQHDHVHAKLAVDMFLYRLAQHIASLLVSLGGPMDALVFTAGIGEHAAEIRERTLRELGPVLPTIELDPERNAADGLRSNGVLTRDGGWPLVLDIATDEESMIAQECIRFTHVQ